jgi:release factor glutamine methyltransferase
VSITVEQALAAATRDLAEAGIDAAAGDARRLMAHALAIAPDRLTLALKEPLMPAALSVLESALADRKARKPVSHILGRREFWGRDFIVGPEVLDPRPETEILIEAALARSFSQVLDLGTGSGCILFTLLAERTEARGMGVDLSEEALKVAVRNRAALGLDQRAILGQSDWFSHVAGTFDLIVANPPYVALEEMAHLAPEVVRWEPMSALCPGMSGIEAYEAIAAGVMEFLEPDGRLLVEIGPTQAAQVVSLFKSAGLDPVAIYPDLDGRDRVVEMQKPV